MVLTAVGLVGLARPVYPNRTEYAGHVRVLGAVYGVVGGADVDDVVHLQHVRQQPGHVGVLGDRGEGVVGWFELGVIHFAACVSVCSLAGPSGS